MGVFFPSDLLGQYSMTMRLIQIPGMLFIAAIGQVYFERAVREHEGRTLDIFLEKVLGQQMVVGCLVVLYLMLFAGNLSRPRARRKVASRPEGYS